MVPTNNNEFLSKNEWATHQFYQPLRLGMYVVVYLKHIFWKEELHIALNDIRNVS